MRSVTLGGLRVQRCSLCGTRLTAAEDPPRLVVTCPRCSLPFVLPGDLAPEDATCAACASEGEAVSPPDPGIWQAAEAEVRSALESRWTLVSSDRLEAYLAPLVRELLRRIDGAPEESRVVLVDEPTLRTLTLPSGLVLLSLGLLRFLEDEAELVFVLGHELAHAAPAEAALRLVRSSFDAVAGDGEGSGWIDGAVDLVKLGCGRPREHEADLVAVRATYDQGYDTASVLEYLRRLGERIEQGDPHVADMAAAHPLPRERIRHIRSFLRSVPSPGGVLRVNREVFRRAVADLAEEGSLRPASLRDAWPAARRISPWGALLWVAGAAMVALALAALVVQMLG